MKKVVALVSILSLVLIVLAPVLFYVDTITLEACKVLLLIATVVWFASSLRSMGHGRREEAGT